MASRDFSPNPNSHSNSNSTDYPNPYTRSRSRSASSHPHHHHHHRHQKQEGSLYYNPDTHQYEEKSGADKLSKERVGKAAFRTCLHVFIALSILDTISHHQQKKCQQLYTTPAGSSRSTRNPVLVTKGPSPSMIAPDLLSPRSERRARERKEDMERMEERERREDLEERYWREEARRDERRGFGASESRRESQLKSQEWAYKYERRRAASPR